jgi:hypothetical protein
MASSYVNTGRQVVDDPDRLSYLDRMENDNDDQNDHNRNKQNNKYDYNDPNGLSYIDRIHNENNDQNDQARKQQQPKQLQHQNQKQTDNNNNINNRNQYRHNNNSNQSDPNYNGFMKYQENVQNYNSNSGSQKSLSLEYGKSIKLLRNGDEFYRGQKYVINSRKYRYFDVFLDDISDKMNAQFGAVRTIHTPVNGHRVKNLDEMEDGKTYVAAGSGRFIRLK